MRVSVQRWAVTNYYWHSLMGRVMESGTVGYCYYYASVSELSDNCEAVYQNIGNWRSYNPLLAELLYGNMKIDPYLYHFHDTV